MIWADGGCVGDLGVALRRPFVFGSGGGLI